MTKLYYYSFEIKSFGTIYLASVNSHLVFLHMDKNALVDYAKVLQAELEENYEYNAEAVNQIKEYFSGKRKEFSLKIMFFAGTDFQKKVWNELSNVTYGKTSAYKEIARNIKHNKAIRAVGTAIGKNPIPVIIPCHRIVNSNGKLGGFSLGLDKKKYLLELERYSLTDKNII
jgi:methylated-DNA-[protein]-cysteine S-methyltransferase